MSDRFPMTKEGHKKLHELLEYLKSVERPKWSRAIGVAREHGDLSENAEYHAAKEAQGMLEARIRNIESQLGAAEVVDPSTMKGDKVMFSAIVKVMDLETDEPAAYQIVGELEADFETGKISIKSPIARGLIGKSVGDLVDIEVPGGTKSLEIIEVIYR